MGHQWVRSDTILYDDIYQITTALVKHTPEVAHLSKEAHIILCACAVRFTSVDTRSLTCEQEAGGENPDDKSKCLPKDTNYHCQLYNTLHTVQ